jgi:hypothetical protein
MIPHFEWGIAFGFCVNSFPLADFIIQVDFLTNAILPLNESTRLDSYPRRKGWSNWGRDLKILFSSGWRVGEIISVISWGEKQILFLQVFLKPWFWVNRETFRKK